MWHESSLGWPQGQSLTQHHIPFNGCARRTSASGSWEELDPSVFAPPWAVRMAAVPEPGFQDQGPWR